MKKHNIGQHCSRRRLIVRFCDFTKIINTFQLHDTGTQFYFEITLKSQKTVTTLIGDQTAEHSFADNFCYVVKCKVTVVIMITLY